MSFRYKKEVGILYLYLNSSVIMEIELSVIIVNYNGLKYLKECFDSLKDSLKNISFEIIVIDNNSSDESCVYIKQNYPNIVLIESIENLGFGKGNNEAVKKARGNYLLLINNDTVVQDELGPVLDFLKSDDKIGVIGINMLDKDKNYIPAAGNFPNPWNMFQLKKLLDKGKEFKRGQFSAESYEVDWLGGSFLLLPIKVYHEIRGFDKDYFMYVEDVDFCKKITNKGYKRIFLPNYNYIHFVGFNNTRKPLLIKGYEIYISKHLKGINFLLSISALKLNKQVKKIKKALKPY
jgi:GT2 family glycosyltransferase